MVLFRAAVKQIARRHGYLASFMCRPALPNVMSSGWHLHQSLIERKTRPQCLRRRRRDGLSPIGRHFLAGLLAHARRGGRFHHADRQRLQALPALFAGARPRHLGARQSRRDGPRARRSRAIRRRIWKIASASRRPIRISTWPRRSMPGLDGIARKREPGPSADTPYEASAPLLPENLGEALAALRADDCFRAGFGAGLRRLLRAHQGGRARALPQGAGRQRRGHAWEQKRYLIWIL